MCSLLVAAVLKSWESLEFVESERNETTPVYNFPQAYFSTTVISEKNRPGDKAIMYVVYTVCRQYWLIFS